MMLQGCRKADRAEVVEGDCFATPNSLKSHRQRNLLSSVGNTCARTPKLCMPSRPIHPSKNYYAALKSRTAANLHSPAAPPVPYFPRLRALALFGRRPPQRVDSLFMPASENLHNNGSSLLTHRLVGERDKASAGRQAERRSLGTPHGLAPWSAYSSASRPKKNVFRLMGWSKLAISF